MRHFLDLQRRRGAQFKIGIIKPGIVHLGRKFRINSRLALICRACGLGRLGRQCRVGHNLWSRAGSLLGLEHRVLNASGIGSGGLGLSRGDEPGNAGLVHSALLDSCNSAISDQVAQLPDAKLLSVRRRNRIVYLGSGFGQGEARLFFIRVPGEGRKISLILLQERGNMPKFLRICGKQVFLILDSGLKILDA